MVTLNVDISELEYRRFQLPGKQLAFSELVDIISRELTRQNLIKTVELAERYGLSEMTMDEITAEVKAVRQKNAAHS